MTDKEKIEQIMLDKQLNNTQFSSMIGISAGALSHITSGRSNPTLNILRSIKDAFPDLNPQWLFFDDGPMYLEAEPDVPKTVYQADLFQDAPTAAPSAPRSENKAHIEPQTERMASPTPAQMQEMVRAATEMVNIKEIVEQSVAQTMDQLRQIQRKIVEVRVFFDDGTFETFHNTSHEK